MTNRKIKNFQINRLALAVAEQNYRMIAMILLTLNDLYPKTFYPKKLVEWLDKYTISCKQFDEYDEAGVLEFKLNGMCDEYGITFEECRRIAADKLADFQNEQIKDIYARNLQLMLLETAVDFGFGVKRINAVKEYLTEHNWSGPETELRRRTGVSTDFEKETQTFDISQVRYKERRASYSEGMDAKRHLAALKAYQGG